MEILEDTTWQHFTLSKAEILPDNERTAVIMKHRLEEELAAKEKFEQMQKLKDNEEKKRKQKERNFNTDKR